jgi:AraC-like DNA-binding protein
MAGDVAAETIMRSRAARRQREFTRRWHAVNMLGPNLDVTFGGRLGTLVDGCWWRTIIGPGVVVPDGAIDVMWTPGSDPWLAGPDMTPRPVDLPVGAHVVGVRLRPGIASAVLGDDVAHSTDRRVPLTEVWPPDLTSPLRDALDASPTGSEAASRLAAAIADRVPDDHTPDPVVVDAVAAIRTGRLPDAAELSDRQLRRRFTREMGYGTAFFRRVVRLDALTSRLGRRPGWPIARLAAECGYFDEAHLWRDCVALTGRTPAELRPAA